MAAKRFLDQDDSSSDQHHEKKRKAAGSRFAYVVRKVIAGNFWQNLYSNLEPMIQRVVREEIERGFSLSTRTLSGSSSQRIQGVESSRLKLSFSHRISLPMFTSSKIVDLESNPLQIILLETRGDRMIQTSLSYPVKLEIVVLDGDFPHGDGETWTSEEFEKNIVRARAGKRPLLTGESHVIMRDGAVPLGEVEFTDNSSWIRSRKFRLGARVVQRSSGGIENIQEAISEAFIVRDHRGELYKKHHPPMLEDEVWRLEKIGKGGSFHRKLASEGIRTVQQFLKLYIVEPSKLRTILGGMSEKMWDVTIKHARNCDLGRKLYVYGGPSYTIILNPICEVVKVVVDGQTYTNQYLSSLNRGYIEDMVKRAYANWNSLQEVVDVQLSETTLLTQGDLVDQYPNNNQTIATSFQHNALFTDQESSLQYNAQAEGNGWVEAPAFVCTPVECGVPYTFPNTPSDGELSPAIPFAHGT